MLTIRLVGFFTYIFAVLLPKVRNEPDACKKRYIYPLFFKAEQFTPVRVQNVGCVYYCCCFYYAPASYNCKSGLAVVDLH